MGTHPIFESDFDCLTDSNTYLVLRELHKFEMAIATESEMNRKIQQVIDVLISDDNEVEDIRSDTQIPENVQKKLSEQDEEEKKEIEDFEKYGKRDEEETQNTVVMM